VFPNLALIREEYGINVYKKLQKHIEKNSVNLFTEFIKLVLINASSFTIIVNNVVIKPYIKSREFSTMLVGEDVLKNLKKLLKEP